jgi:hypothetical protein
MEHLWEAKHPYYMNDGNYYSNDCTFNYETLEEFLDEWQFADPDYNRVHRWDWNEGEAWEIPTDGSDDVQGKLNVYFVLQRKARLLSCHIDVRRSDEPKVIEYLKFHAKREISIWSPLIISE